VGLDLEATDFFEQFLETVEHGKCTVEVVRARDILKLTKSRFTMLEIDIEGVR
jgi:hypothetical protein